MRRDRRRRGATLILALLLLVLVAVVVAAAASRTRRIAAGRALQQNQITATHALSGAIEHARWSLASDPEHAGGTVEVGDAVVTVAVHGAGATRRVGATVRLPHAPFAEHTVHTVNAELRLGDAGDLPTVTAWRE